MSHALVVLGYGLLGLTLAAVTGIFFIQKRMKLVGFMTILGAIVGWGLVGTAAVTSVLNQHLHLPAHLISFKIGAWTGGPLAAIALLVYRRFFKNRRPLLERAEQENTNQGGEG